MKTTLYVYAENGFLADVLSTSSATNGISVKRGDDLIVQLVFHDGTEAVELPADAVGSISVKASKHYDGAAVAQAALWRKMASADEGYELTLTVLGPMVDALLGTGDSVTLMCEVSWTTEGTRTTSPTAPFTVLNNLTR